MSYIDYMRYILYIVHLYSYNLYYVKNEHIYIYQVYYTYDIIIIILNKIMEIICRTIGWLGPGPKLPAIYDFCKYERRTDTVGLSIVVVRLAWTYFKLFFHIRFSFFGAHTRVYISIIYTNLVIAGHVLSKRTLPTYYYIFMNIIIYCNIYIYTDSAILYVRPWMTSSLSGP